MKEKTAEEKAAEEAEAAKNMARIEELQAKFNEEARLYREQRYARIFGKQ